MMGWTLGKNKRADIVSASAAAALMVILALAGCASSTYRAPVEERAVFGRTAASNAPAAITAVTPAAPASAASDASKLPGAENASKPGYYTVKPGDTLIRIGLETGQNWKDILKWNSLDNANVIEVGQVLRVVPPGADPNAVTTRAVTTAKMETRSLDGSKAPSASAPSTTAPAVTPTAPPVPAAPPAVAAPREGDDDVNWLWPANGPVVAGFDETRSKGLSISGKAGDPVVASADGKVVYAGSGLRGYGNLVIIKHNNIYLTAYAHNQALMVKEEQNVKRGQKIAEMGSTDSDRVLLHFEIRKQGKPIDPAKLLPAR
jgi:lipoprotein NlpD